MELLCDIGDGAVVDLRGRVQRVIGFSPLPLRQPSAALRGADHGLRAGVGSVVGYGDVRSLPEALEIPAKSAAVLEARQV